MDQCIFFFCFFVVVVVVEVMSWRASWKSWDRDLSDGDILLCFTGVKREVEIMIKFGPYRI